jgi:hypothetical protein
MRLARVVFGSCCVLLLLGTCSREKAPTLPQENALIGDIDLETIQGPNLLTFARGASIVSRTAEQTLQNSAAHAIDGDWLTHWRSAPGGPEQTFVVSLGARSRIDRVGVIAPQTSDLVPQQVRFEASDDTVAWRPVTTFDLHAKRDPQVVRVPPFEASYLRVQTIGTTHYYVALGSLIAMGSELEAPRQPPVEGCWHINGMPARFARRGTSIVGVIGNDPPMYVLGGTDGRSIRLQWLRGAMWGPAIITLDPRRQALSGTRWHERVHLESSGDGWFGTPSRCNEVTFNETAIAEAMLKRAGTWMAYGESALDTITAILRNAPNQRFEIVTRTQARRDAVRAPLRSRGVDLSRLEFAVTPANAINETQRVMADAVELHLR